jgi:Tol biopolymer transport system component
MAAPFDTRKLEVVGEPAPVAEDVSPLAFSASATGVLVYRTGPATRILASTLAGTTGQLTWFDRGGKVLGTEGEPDFYTFGVKLSPDGTRLALTRRNQGRQAKAGQGNFDIWIYEFARGVSQRFTSDPGPDRAPVWSPDGKTISYVSSRPENGLYQKAADGAGQEELLIKVPRPVALNEWSRDGRFLLFYDGGRTAGDIFVFVAKPEAKVVPLLNSPQFAERGGSFSPDGRWFAYTSDESGKNEVYVRAFDPVSVTANGSQFLVSTAGGTSAHWSRDGREIFYQAADGTIMSAPVTTTPTFKAQAPQALFKVASTNFWDVTSDGKRFLIPVPQGANSPAPYKVVLNWTSTLRK